MLVDKATAHTDSVMKPLMCRDLPTDVYNPIWEAVSRSTEEQGRRLVGAIEKLLDIREDIAAAGAVPEQGGE